MALTKPNYGILDIAQTSTRQVVKSFGGGLQAEAVTVKGYDSVSYNDVDNPDIATGTPGVAGLQVNLGMPFAGGEYGGMVMGCPPSVRGSRIVIDSIRGGYSYLKSNDTTIAVTDTSMIAFSGIGYTSGESSNFNYADGNNVLAFNTTNIVYPETTAKSVTFDCVDNWGNALYIGLRRIEFLDVNGNVIPMLRTSFTAYSTSVTEPGSNEYSADAAFDTSGPKDSWAWDDQSWAAIGYEKQRLTIVLNTPLTFYGIRVNNFHSQGTVPDYGVKNIVVQITDDELTQTQGETYDDKTGNLKQYLSTQLYEHPATDTVADQDYKTETWHINPATGFGMCIINGSGVDRRVMHPMGKKVVFGAYKQLDATSSWAIQSDKIPQTYFISWNTSNVAASGESFRSLGTATYLDLGTGVANVGRNIFYGWFGDDLSDLHPGMTGVRGASACVSLTDGGTFDCGFEPETILFKRTSAIGDWNVVSRDAGWNQRTKLNAANPMDTLSTPPIVSGSVVTLSPDFAGTQVFMVFGKEGNLPTGKSLQIKATVADPFVATISDGFAKATGDKDILIGHDADVVYPQTEADGEYDIVLDPDGTLDLVPVGGYVTDFTGWKNTKLLLGSCTISDGLIVDIDEVAVGDQYTAQLIPIVRSTTYVLPNMFRTDAIEVTVQMLTSQGWIAVQWELYYEVAAQNFGARWAVTKDTISITTSDHSMAFGSGVFEDPEFMRVIVRRTT